LGTKSRKKLPRPKTFLGHRKRNGEKVRAASRIVTHACSVRDEAKELDVRAAKVTLGTLKDYTVLL
jgi:hypothetical protein